MNQVKTGLVLEGGGMRGLFTAGILDVLMENDIHVDGIIGVSAGACFGCNLKSHQAGRVLRYNMRFAHEPRYMGLRSLLKTGDLVGGEFAFHTLPEKLDVFDARTFEEDRTEFHVVCTDVATGEPVYKRLDRIDYDSMEWIRASASMPIVSRPVRIGDLQMLDGGVSDSIPLKHFQEIGFGRNIVILTQPLGYRKSRTRLMPLFRIFERRHPAIIRAMQRRHLMYNAQLDYLGQQQELGNTLVIAPEEILPISRTCQKEEAMQRVYDMGRKAGLEQIGRIRSFIMGE